MFRPGANRKPRPLTASAGNAAGSAARPGGGLARPKVKEIVPRSAPSSEPPAKRSKPLVVKRVSAAASAPDSGVTLYFAALYTRKSKKKAKSFLDGFVSIRNDKLLVLMSEVGKEVAKETSRSPLGGLKEGNTIEIRSFEVEIDCPLAEEDFYSGRIFLPGGKALRGSTVGQASKLVLSAATKKKFKVPAGPRNAAAGTKVQLKPLHSPDTKDAIVIQGAFKTRDGRKTLPIVIDPFLGKHMRPHQSVGVKYLFSCVEGKGKGKDDNQGVVLADEMGLGKSLQSIALMWTLLKQGPFGKPIAEKAIVVTPASLVGNWVSEIKKWLGDERLKPLEVVSGQTKSFKGNEPIFDFVRGSVRKVLIISYEMFRSYAGELCNSNCGLIICDEGHRLKSSAGNKTIDALMKIPCRRRVILTGTPVQNDLEEFFSMCNFVNPGALGDLTTFRSVFAQPILKSRDTNATCDEVRIGAERGDELNRVARKFVLRRTSETLEKYLPPKTENVVVCRLTPEQQSRYEAVCEEGFASIGKGKSSVGAAFTTMTKLRKICCHPAMMNAKDDGTGKRVLSKSALQDVDVSLSGKMQVAMSVCASSVEVGDRLVLVSNFTSTLDILEVGLKNLGLRFLRLDGSTPAKSRLDLVKVFNAGRNGESVFLLSAKAGGVGLNLIGANRLILMDPDWNPSTDLQAMGRVWRDGQKKEVFIYRLLSLATIEEKIYQRQLFKGELQLDLGSDSVGYSKSAKKAKSKGRQSGTTGNFSADELRDLFTFNCKVRLSDTLDVLARSRNQEFSCLLAKFTAYRDKLERAAGIDDEAGRSGQAVNDFVFCGLDAVLSAAVNETVATQGIVTYARLLSVSIMPAFLFRATFLAGVE